MGLLDKLVAIFEQFRASMNTDVLNTVLHLSSNLCANAGPAKEAFLKSKIFMMICDLFGIMSWSPEIDTSYAWLFSNILTHKHSLTFEEESMLASVLCKLFLKYEYGAFPELDMECLWGMLSYCNSNDNRDARTINFINSKCLKRVILALKKHAVEGGNQVIIAPIIKLIGIAAAYSNELVDMIMDLDVANVDWTDSGTNHLRAVQVPIVVQERALGHLKHHGFKL